MKTVQALGLVLSLGLWSCAAPTQEPTLGAAASLRHVLPDLVHSYEASTGREAPQISYGASGKIVGQLLAGAPLSGVVLASARQLERLKGSRLVTGDKIFNLATNRLVLARRSSQEARPLRQVAEDAATRPLAIGDPRFVPAGRYARSALMAEGLWGGCEAHLVRGGHVAGVLAYLKSGAVDAASVYETELRGQDELTGSPLSPGDGPSPQVLGAEILSVDAHGSMDAFLCFLSSMEGQKIFRTHGCGPPG